MELNASSRLASLVTAKFVKRTIAEYVTKDGHPALTIRQVINDRDGKVWYDHDIMQDKYSPTFMHESNYADVYRTVQDYLKSKRGWRAVIPMPEHEPSGHLEPQRYEFHVEFLDENGRTGKLDHEVKARNRFDAFTELLQGLKRSGGMEVVHRITCTEHK
jgi:hypothetical protein